MVVCKPLWVFFERVSHDPRIGSTHIGLFAALVHYWQGHSFINPIPAYCIDILPVAKMSANTYHKCMRDLHDFGYIRYEPSFKRNSPSHIFLKIGEVEDGRDEKA
ncbi:hypothetical protein HDF19_00090 [Mucilaginibacter sp. E4BP6]|uniref:hypothetical protein n=1 Tax=Mucilaginibacter sp. E4BP6 TaxID=2723089 RepID=UPI0015CC8A19|nr:hypothetical protein [Mucilaginibacter sp. E4BP6]NYE67997.1 hypothetical protein [Mucilaginibacter sp. E4BP6]